MEKKTVNEQAFFDYLNSCYDNRANTFHSIIDVLTPALLAVGVTDEAKINAIITQIAADKTAELDATIKLLESFVTYVTVTDLPDVTDTEATPVTVSVESV